MDEESKQEIIRILGAELSKQKAIMDKHSARAINPDGSKEYEQAKEAFDNAHRQIRELEDKIAYLQTSEKYEPTIIDRILNIVDKLIKDDDDWKNQTSATTGVR